MWPAVLDHVDVGTVSIDDYVPVVGREAVEEIRRLTVPLKGASIAQINATVYGGGVSELTARARETYLMHNLLADELRRLASF